MFRDCELGRLGLRRIGGSQLGADAGQLGAHLGRLDELDGRTEARPARRPGRTGCGPVSSTSTRPSGPGGPMRMRVPSWARHQGSTAGSTHARASTGARRCSTSSVIKRHASSRSKPSGRTTGSPVGSTAVTRSTRKVRSPASVSATRYQTWPLAASPSGCTTRVVACARRGRRSRARPARPRRRPAARRRGGAAPAGATSDGPTRRGRRPPRSTRPRRSSRIGSGSARTSLRRAAFTWGVADDDGPATRNRARASAAVSPLRSVRPPPASCQPPLRPWQRVHGQAGHAERFEVAAGRALRHLELGRHLGRGHLATRLEEQENGHEPVGAHAGMFADKPARILTGFGEGAVPVDRARSYGPRRSRLKDRYREEPDRPRAHHPDRRRHASARDQLLGGDRPGHG